MCVSNQHLGMRSGREEKARINKGIQMERVSRVHRINKDHPMQWGGECSTETSQRVGFRRNYKSLSVLQ